MDTKDAALTFECARKAWIVEHWLKKTNSKVVLDTKRRNIADLLGDGKYDVRSLSYIAEGMTESLKKLAFQSIWSMDKEASEATKASLGMSLIHAFLHEDEGDETVLTVNQEDLFTVGCNKYGVKTLNCTPAAELNIKAGDYDYDAVHDAATYVIDKMLGVLIRATSKAEKAKHKDDFCEK